MQYTTTEDRVTEALVVATYLSTVTFAAVWAQIMMGFPTSGRPEQLIVIVTAVLNGVCSFGALLAFLYWLRLRW